MDEAKGLGTSSVGVVVQAHVEAEVDFSPVETSEDVSQFLIECFLVSSHVKYTLRIMSHIFSF